MILVNGQPEDRISVLDRGLQYGDGLFETIAFRRGSLEFLQQHLERLELGCNRLKIPFIALETLLADLTRVCDTLISDAVIKIIVTRGQGGRGYKATPSALPTCIISSHVISDNSSNNSQGIRVRICQQTVSENVSLAGIKHLNRLEQVLARSEWDDDAIAEGLMFNRHKQLIEGTMSNVFIVSDGKLLTPELELSGVCGIMRNQVISAAQLAGIDVSISTISLDQLRHADEVFITNSLIDIWPVVHIDQIEVDYKHGIVTQGLQSKIADLVRL